MTIGEACHVIDPLMWLCGSLPKSVHAVVLPDPPGLNDTVRITLECADGLIGRVSCFPNRSKGLSKECVEVYDAGRTGIIRDFKELDFSSSGKPFCRKSFAQDEGQANMVKAFIARIRAGGAPAISVAESFTSTRATCAVLESIRTRQPVAL